MKIRAGSEVYLQVKVYNMRVVPPDPPDLFDPDGGVFVTLTDPTGGMVLMDESMPQLATGVYNLAYQTSALSPLGLWTASFKAVNGGSTNLSQDAQAFELVPPRPDLVIL